MAPPWDVWDADDVDAYLGSVDIGLPHAVYPVVTRRLGSVTGQIVLDYGCGDGRYARLLERQGPARIIGADVSPEMIAAARRDSGSRAEYHVVQDNVLEFLPNASVDAAVAIYVFMMVPSKAALSRSLREIARVLKPTGRFVYAITHPTFVDRPAFDYRNAFGEGGFDYFAEARRYRFIGRRPDGREVEAEWHDYHHTLATYLNTTVEAGFALVHLDEVAYPDDVVRRYAIPPQFRTFPHALVVSARRAHSAAA